MKTIQFFTEQMTFTIKNKTLLREWLTKIIHKHKKSVGEINIIFCSDDYLLKLNEQYLGHDTFTDIITFDFVEGKIISGDIFISVDQMKENAKLFHVEQSTELHRLIIHGVLHLLGYKDEKPKDKKNMTTQEEIALQMLNLKKNKNYGNNL
jgi:rRNA maturation RNase YbeY